MLFAQRLVHSEYPVTQSFANVVLLKYLAMTLFYFGIFLKENTSDKKSGAREFKEQSSEKLQWICSTSWCKAKSKAKHLSLLSHSRLCFSHQGRTVQLNFWWRHASFMTRWNRQSAQQSMQKSHCTNKFTRSLEASPILFSADLGRFPIPLQEQITDTF